MSEQENNARKETCLSEPKLRLYGKVCQGAEKPPVLIPDIFENNPRFRVRTNVQNDANKGWIEVPMTSIVFAQLAETARLLARGELRAEDGTPLNGFVMDNFGHPFTQQGRSKEKMLTSKIQMQRDDRGIITLTITAGKNRPLCEFVLVEDDYHHFRDTQGNKMPVGVASRLMTIGYFNAMERFFTMACRDYIEPAWIAKRKAQQAQNGGGWQGNRGGNGGGYGGGQGGNGGGYGGNQGGYGGHSNGGQQAPQAASFDVEIPF